MKAAVRLLAIIAAAVVSLWPTLVLASIALPDSYSIDSIEAYRHVVEANDQLYLIKYQINYASLPSSSAQEDWLVRLISSNGTDLSVTSPAAYHNEGYGLGLATIYFSADAVAGATAAAPLAWNGSYTVSLEGNPLLSWAGTPPVITNSTFNKWSTSTSVASTSSELQVRIIYLANELGTSWSENMTDSSNGATVLSAYAEPYFEALIPSLRTICPALFSSVSVGPTPDVRTKNTTVQAANDSLLDGTVFDCGGIATLFGVSKPMARGIVWSGFWLAMTCTIAWQQKATRICLFVFGFAMIGGAITGFMGMIAGIAMGILGALSIVYGFMWKRAT